MKIADTTFLVVDVETTGLDPVKDRIVEVAAVKVAPKRANEIIIDALVNPGVPIPPGASAIHHIIDSDVTDRPGIDDVLPDGLPDDYILVAHNAAFDVAFFPESPKPWLCTMRLAKKVWPDAGQYGNQFLRYWLHQQTGTLISADCGIAPHRAAYDAVVTAGLLRFMLRRVIAHHQITDLGELLEFVMTPTLLDTIVFGKYKGKSFAEIPRDYLSWLTLKSNDVDVIYTAKTVLGAE